jgi:tRNA threonylcarbamoyl adenosine modification protein (Sua5/YciO/YrdC/YwlC family)
MVLDIHPQNPQSRLITQVVNVLNNGGIIVYPTDSGYCLGCKASNKKGIERISKIRNLSKHHNWTLMTPGLKNIATYAKVDNNAFRLLKKITPGSWTVILPATSKVPNIVLNKRKTIGIRISPNAIVQALLTQLDEIMSVSLLIDGYDFYDITDVCDVIESKVDMIIDGGYNPPLPTTVLDLTNGKVDILREGGGDIEMLQ